MSVELEPPELGFKRPFTQEVSQVLRLRNNNSDPVAFKVKTTAPKQYCVRPNSGRIEPGQHVEVQVLLQAMKEDPPADAKCRDKFLVQSVAVTAGSDANVSQVWANIEQNAKSSIQEKKIRVNFLPADSSGSGSGLSPAAQAGVTAAALSAGAGGAATAAAASSTTTNGLASHEDEPPAYSSPSAADREAGQSTLIDQSATDATETTAAEPSTLSAVAAAIPTSQDQLKAQLEEAKVQIARLQGQVQDGLRQRKPQEAAEKTVQQVQESLKNAPAPGGVPIQIVAGLCLLCFIIAWLFF